ncbi:unnamed protein product [Prunus brigantina]
MQPLQTTAIATGKQQQLCHVAAEIATQPRSPVASSVMQPQSLGAGAATHDSASIHDHLNAISGHSLVLEQIHSLPPLQPHLTYAPMYTSNGTLVHLPLGPIHTSIPDPCSQVSLNSRVDQLRQRVDDQNNLISQLLRQINLETNWQGRERDRADETQTSASCTLSRSTIHSRLRSQEARARELLREERNDRRSQPVREPTRGDNSWRNLRKLNPPICLTGRETKEVNLFKSTRKSTILA